jgi:hypothetical protein
MRHHLEMLDIPEERWHRTATTNNKMRSLTLHWHCRHYIGNNTKMHSLELHHEPTVAQYSHFDAASTQMLDIHEERW